MSIEHIALKNIELSTGRKLYRHKKDFIKALASCVSEYELDEAKDFFSTYRLIPDSWGLENGRDGLQIFAIEVEDSNKLTEEKLKNYSMLWFYLDCIGIDLRLETFDRYGVICTKIPLNNVYCAFLMTRNDYASGAVERT